MILFITFLSLLVGSLPLSAFPNDTSSGSRIIGTVTDRSTGEALIGVNILIEGTQTGTTTGVDGRFSISGLEPGIYLLRFSYLGYETFLRGDIVVRPARSSQVDIQLSEVFIQGAEVTVFAGYFEQRSDAPVSTVSFNPEEIRRSPGSGQEALRIVTLLPSVVSVGDTRQDILVRGGSNLENGFMVDNIPMPGIQHFYQQNGKTSGPIGIINTDLISNLEFRSGGFGSSMGHAMSSFTNITYREGNRNGLHGNVSMSMAGFGGILEQGIAGGKGSYLFSARRSYLDLIADAINAGGAPRYSDAQLKVVYELTPTQKLTFLNIYGSSQFQSDEKDAIDGDFDMFFDTKNQQNTIGVNLRSVWNAGLFTNTSVSWSIRTDDTFTYRIKETEPIVISERDYRMNSTAHQLALRSVTYKQFNRSLGLEFGTDVRYESTSFDYLVAPSFDASGNPTPAFGQNLELSGILAAGFTSLSLRPTNRSVINSGLRVDYSDYNKQVDLSPRVSARYELTSRLSLNGAWGFFHQVNPRYLMSQSTQNRKLSNPRAEHYIAGVEYLLTPETLISVEVYQKNYSRMPALSSDIQQGDLRWIFDVAGGYLPELESTGIGRSKGIEFLMQRKMASGFYGTISAAFFRSRYKDFQGNWQNRNYDIRYLFSVNGGYRPNDKWEVSARWSWQGGSPRTPFDENASIAAGSGILDFSRFNELRIDDFHALYVRFDRRFFYRKTNLVVFMELWNAYNRTNVDSYEWNRLTNREVVANQFSILPVGGISFEF